MINKKVKKVWEGKKQEPQKKNTRTSKGTMECAAEIITVELFRCINYMRTTVDGILACNNPNVWNVFGGLSRTKKAVFDILANELRMSGNKSKHDMIMVSQKKCFVYIYISNQIKKSFQVNNEKSTQTRNITTGVNYIKYTSRLER